MPFCPNPECPHRKKTGKPAEFTDGVACCSDCGSSLTEKINETTETKQKSYISEFLQNDFLRRLFYTLSLVAIWRMLSHVAVPGIDFNVMENWIDRTGGDILLPRAFLRFTVLTLGLIPYITAYVLVEILALFVKPLKSWRESGQVGRLKLKKTALVVTLIVAIVQGSIIINRFEGMNDGQLFNNPVWLFQIIFILSITAGTFLSIGIADLITAKGIGHGVSVLIFTGLAARFFSGLSKIDRVVFSRSPFEIFLLTILSGIALVALIIFFEKSHRRIPVKFDDGKEAYIPLKLTTAGIVPASWAASIVIGSIVMLPVTIFSFTNSPTLQKIAVELSPGKFVYSITYAIAIIFLYYLFTAFFYRPEKIMASLKKKNAYISLPSGEEPGKYVDRSLETMAFFGSLYLCLLVLMAEVSIRVLGLPIFIGGVALIKTVAITLDLLGESQIRKKSGCLVKVAEFHDIPKAGLCKSLLEGQGIPCHLRGYYYRALFYFFGPYVEISALVPEGRVQEAVELINRHIE